MHLQGHLQERLHELDTARDPRPAAGPMESEDMTHANGTPAPALGPVSWKKSAISNPSGDCVEVADLPDGDVALRNSRDPHGPTLVYTRAEISAFLRGAKAGEFDDLLL